MKEQEGYLHPKHGLIFISDGISRCRAWGTFYRAKTGSLRRFKSPELPMREDREQAEKDLAQYAMRNGLRWIGGEEKA